MQPAAYSKTKCEKILNKLDSGSAVTFNIMGTLKGEHDLIQREVKSCFTIGYKPAHHKAGEKIETDAKISIKTSPDTAPYIVGIEASTKIHKPTSKWDIQAILMQNLQTDTSINVLLDNQGKGKTSISTTIRATQSNEQKPFTQ